MTVSAHIRRRDMIGNLSNRTVGNIVAIAVMARFTIAADPGVVEVQCIPERPGAANRRGHVAERAILARGQVIDLLAGTYNTVMALRTVAGYTAMAECPLGKACISRLMACFAILSCWYMVINLADTDHIVMTCFAARGDARMIVAARGKSTQAMTVTAILVVYGTHVVGIGRHMIGRLATGRNTMAGLAVVHDTGMILEPADKRIRIMAI